MTISGPALLRSLGEHRLLEDERLTQVSGEFETPPDGQSLIGELTQRGWLTPFQARTILAGHAAQLSLAAHVLLDKLGEGGMGQVFKAYHRILRRVDAIKVIRPECLTSRLAVERFYREARAAAAIHHPNICQVYDAGQDGDRHYFVMEFAPGFDLARLVKDRGALPVGEACEYARQSALGLQHAHERGIIHRDIKPSNLLLTSEHGVIKVLDLGLARLRESDEGSGDPTQPLTPNNMMMGTPDFMAPEQAENAREADVRADIYSLGCTLYQLLSGSVPFPGGTLVEKLTRHHSATPVPLAHYRPDVPAGLQAVLSKMMAKLPQQRYQVPAEVAAALHPFRGAAAPAFEALDTRAPISSPSDDNDTPYIPATLEVPAAGISTDPTATRALAGAVVSAPGPATEEITAPGASGLEVTRARPARRRWLPAAAVVVCLGGVAVALLWDSHLRPLLMPDESRQARRDEEDPPKVPPEKTETDGGGKTPGTITPVPPPVAADGSKGVAGDADLKGIASAKTGRERGGEGKADEWKQPQIVHPLASPPGRVAFSGNGARAVVSDKARLDFYDMTRPGEAPAKVSPSNAKLVLGVRAERAPYVGATALMYDGSQQAFATVTEAAKQVPGKPFTTLFDAVVRWGKDRPTVFLGNDADSRLGKGGVRLPTTSALAFSPDGAHLAAAAGATLNLWNARSKESEEIKRVQLNVGTPIDVVACSPGSKHVAAGTRLDGIRVYRLTGDHAFFAELKRKDGRSARAVAFLTDTTLVSGESGGAVCLWRIPTGGAAEPLAPAHVLQGKEWHEAAVSQVAASPDGKHFVTADDAGNVCLGRFDSPESPVWRRSAGGSVKAVGFSEDGGFVLYATAEALGRFAIVPAVKVEARESSEDNRKSAASTKDAGDSGPQG